MWQIRVVAPSTLIHILVFLFGLIIGSFLNVCIVRIPERKSIVTPASACPRCDTPIRPYDNIPLVSWLLLGGRCRACKTRIPAMYPLVELLTGVIFWACYRQFGMTAEGVKWATFSSLMIVLVCTDLNLRILPDKVNYTGLALGLAFTQVTKPADGISVLFATEIFERLPSERMLSLADAVLGALVGGGLLWLVSELYFWMRRREGMGLGDVKMMLMAGAFLGARRTVLTILAGSLLGSVLGIAFILVRRKNVSTYELPFGTFLGAAALFVVFFGMPFMNWYHSVGILRILER
jgi:leader peptidase (prepilin peptidase) / N-methyltransferase